MRFIYGFLLLLLAGLVVAVSSQSTPFKKCDDGEVPKEVRVEGCDELPCLLKRNTNVTAEWDFTLGEDTNTLKPRVRATVAGVTVGYPFPQKNGCSTLKNAKCPLEAGQEVTYMLSMPILRLYPKVSLIIEFAFLNDSDNVEVCYRLPAKVVD